VSAPTLAETVATAVAALLADRTEIAVDAIMPALPQHLQTARPSMKLIRQALVAAGWRGMKLRDGTPVYRAPQAQSDPLVGGGIGDNIGAEQLRLLIERIERLEEEKKGIADDIKDVYAESKSNGYDVKTMRAIVKLRGMEKHHRDESEALLELYKSALGLA
jgi:uncharacterized protein (UPF0335 family)